MFGKNKAHESQRKKAVNVVWNMDGEETRMIFWQGAF